MYLNTVTLTGFLGGDAESRTSKSKANFVTFSLATKNSWKDRETGEWNSRTEWHRAIVFGRPAALAATLLKGDHVQIQGQLRTREFEKPADKTGTGKHRVTEIHVTSILKLDRSGKQNAGQSEVEGEA
jgi:single-strand DNA-binding protein